jgi:hypothetical protein
LAAGFQDKGYHGSADEQLARLSSELGFDERRKLGEQGLELRHHQEEEQVRLGNRQDHDLICTCDLHW